MGFVSHPLPPIVDESSQILILGSFPSLKSFEEMFYYAHPKNQFWRLLGDIYGVCVNTKEEKIRLLRNSKIALWDVVAACERVNSSDSNLKNTKPNEIPNLLGRFPNIQKVFFTSKIWLPGKTQLCPHERLERLSCRHEAKYLALRQSRGVNFAGKYTPSSYRI